MKKRRCRWERTSRSAMSRGRSWSTSCPRTNKLRSAKLQTSSLWTIIAREQSGKSTRRKAVSIDWRIKSLQDLPIHTPMHNRRAATRFYAHLTAQARSTSDSATRLGRLTSCWNSKQDCCSLQSHRHKEKNICKASATISKWWKRHGKITSPKKLQHQAAKNMTSIRRMNTVKYMLSFSPPRWTSLAARNDRKKLPKSYLSSLVSRLSVTACSKSRNFVACLETKGQGDKWRGIFESNLLPSQSSLELKNIHLLINQKL